MVGTCSWVSIQLAPQCHLRVGDFSSYPNLVWSLRYWPSKDLPKQNIFLQILQKYLIDRVFVIHTRPFSEFGQKKSNLRFSFSFLHGKLFGNVKTTALSRVVILRFQAESPRGLLKTHFWAPSSAFLIQQFWDET